MKKIILVSFLLFTNTALACNSYEDCMAHKNSEPHGPIHVDRQHATDNGYDSYNELALAESDAQINVLKAIAFKLDEISKRLKND